jgi:hypothetical protein
LSGQIFIGLAHPGITPVPQRGNRKQPARFMGVFPSVLKPIQGNKPALARLAKNPAQNLL